MYNKHIRDTEQCTTRLRWAREQLRLAQEAEDRTAHPTLINASAYLCDCADANRAPTFRDAAQRGYAIPASALSSALGDAISLAWVGMGEGNKLYWRDAGLTPDCVMVRLGKQCKLKIKVAP